MSNGKSFPATTTPEARREESPSPEWEHIVPAHAVGQSFVEWRDGHPDCLDKKGKPFKGRNCAMKVAIPFRYIEADMYNLVPAIGRINGLRSDYGRVIGDQKNLSPNVMTSMPFRFRIKPDYK